MPLDGTWAQSRAGALPSSWPGHSSCPGVSQSSVLLCQQHRDREGWQMSLCHLEPPGAAGLRSPLGFLQLWHCCVHLCNGNIHLRITKSCLQFTSRHALSRSPNRTSDPSCPQGPSRSLLIKNLKSETAGTWRNKLV